MADIGALVERLVECGLSVGEASSIIAEAVAAGAATASYRRSPGAIRQQRFRERNKASQRNAQDPKSEDVTERHEALQSVTNNAAPLSIEENKKEKKERGRASQVPADWRPGELAWADGVRELGSVERAERELARYKNNSAAKGTTYKNFDAGWRNWYGRAVDWSPAKSAGLQSGIVRPEETNWRPIMESFRDFGKWPRGHGNEPGSPACRAPPDLLKEFGYG